MSAGDWLPLAQRILSCEWADRRGVNGWCETHDDPWPCDRAQEAAEVLAEELDQPTKEQKMGNETLLTPREVDQVEAALDTPPRSEGADQ